MTRDKTLNTLRKMQEAADRIDAMRRERMGTDGHNAMLAYREGKPWAEMNYSALRAALRIERMESPGSIVQRWYSRACQEQLTLETGAHPKDDCECGHARAEHERSRGRCGTCYCEGFVRPLSAPGN